MQSESAAPSTKRFKLGALTAYPIYVQVPLFQKLAQHPDIDLTVYFCSDWAAETYFEPLYGREVRWDIPLLDGYRHVFLRNYGRGGPRGGFMGLVNPGILAPIVRGDLDALWIHSYAYLTNMLAIASARVARLPVLLRTESSLMYDSKIPRPWWLRVVKASYIRAVCWSVTGGLAIGSRNARFFRHYGLRPDRVFHVPYAIDNERFARSARLGSGRALRTALGIADKTLVFLFIAKLSPEKAPMDLLEAYHKLESTGDVALVFVGDGPSSATLKTRVAELGLKNVYFLGFQNQAELPNYYALGDVFVRADGVNRGDWGLSVNEAMAAGLALISTYEIGASDDLVIAEDNGLLFHAGDVASLAAHMQRLVGNPDLVRKFKDRSHARITDWSYDADVEGILQALHAMA